MQCQSGCRKERCLVHFTYPECTVVVDQKADHLCGHIGSPGVHDVLWLVVKRDPLGDLHGAKHKSELEKERRGQTDARQTHTDVPSKIRTLAMAADILAKGPCSQSTGVLEVSEQIEIREGAAGDGCMRQEECSAMACGQLLMPGQEDGVRACVRACILHAVLFLYAETARPSKSIDAAFSSLSFGQAQRPARRSTC